MVKRDPSKFQSSVRFWYSAPNDRIEVKLKPTDEKNNNYFDYTNGSIDAFAIYNSITEEIALVPVDDLPKDQSYFFLLCRVEIVNEVMQMVIVDYLKVTLFNVFASVV